MNKDSAWCAMIVLKFWQWTYCMQKTNQIIINFPTRKPPHTLLHTSYIYKLYNKDNIIWYYVMQYDMILYIKNINWENNNYLKTGLQSKFYIIYAIFIFMCIYILYIVFCLKTIWKAKIDFFIFSFEGVDK